MKRLAYIPLVFLLPGCGRYADFTLPKLAGGDTSMTFALDAQPQPVIARGADSDVLNPSVVRTASEYLNFYSAYDGKAWRTVAARSEDGIHWQPGSTVLQPDLGGYIAANGSALVDGGTIWYWFETGSKTALRVGATRSADGVQWRKEAAPVLESGPYMSWDERDVADPYVIRAGEYFYMYYLGQDRAEPPRQRIGVARSSDGIRWTKLRSNPILELDGEAYLGEPAVWSSGAFYWMLYTATDFEAQRRLGLARSTDGVHWRKLPTVLAGSEPWDSKVMCDPTVLVEGSQIRLWFGGGDVASPDEGLHGQIGYGTLRPVRATVGQ